MNGGDSMNIGFHTLFTAGWCREKLLSVPRGENFSAVLLDTMSESHDAFFTVRYCEIFICDEGDYFLLYNNEV